MVEPRRTSDSGSHGNNSNNSNNNGSSQSSSTVPSSSSSTKKKSKNLEPPAAVHNPNKLLTASNVPVSCNNVPVILDAKSLENEFTETTIVSHVIADTQRKFSLTLPKTLDPKLYVDENNVYKPTGTGENCYVSHLPQDKEYTSNKLYNELPILAQPGTTVAQAVTVSALYCDLAGMEKLVGHGTIFLQTSHNMQIKTGTHETLYYMTAEKDGECWSNSFTLRIYTIHNTETVRFISNDTSTLCCWKPNMDEMVAETGSGSHLGRIIETETGYEILESNEDCLYTVENASYLSSVCNKFRSRKSGYVVGETYRYVRGPLLTLLTEISCRDKTLIIGAMLLLEVKYQRNYVKAVNTTES